MKSERSENTGFKSSLVKLPLDPSKNSLLSTDLGKKTGDKKTNEFKQSNDFSKRVEELIQLTLGRIEKELQEGEKITLSQLSTTLGILYDKSRLEKNLSTSNQDICINIKIEK